MKWNSKTRIAFFIVPVMLAACTSPPPKPVRPKPNPIAAVTAIRAAGAKYQSSVEVHPLRDPAVDGLMAQVRTQESQSRYAQALDTVHKALAITPRAPDLLQYQAELLIENGQWQQAAGIAQESYDLGPKVGALCARNLATLAQVDIALGKDADAVAQNKRIPSCSVPARVRY